MESDDSAPEDVPIGSQPVDALFTKRLTAKKIHQDKKLHSVKKIKAPKQLKPLPLEVLEHLSQEIPENSILPAKSKKEKGKKFKKDAKGKSTKNPELYELQKLPDFIPLDDVPKTCSTKFKVGILNSIVKNPINKNYKKHKLYHSRNAQAFRQTNVKDNIVKKTLIKRIMSK